MHTQSAYNVIEPKLTDYIPTPDSPLLQITTPPHTKPARLQFAHLLKHPRDVSPPSRISSNTLVTTHAAVAEALNHSNILDLLCLHNLYLTVFHKGPQEIQVPQTRERIAVFAHNANWTNPSHPDNSFLSFTSIQSQNLIAIAEFHTEHHTLQQSNPEQYQQLLNLLQTTGEYTDYNKHITIYETREHRHYNHTRTTCITTLTTLPTPPKESQLPPAPKKLPRSPHSPDYPPPNVTLTDVDVTTTGNILLSSDDERTDDEHSDTDNAAAAPLMPIGAHPQDHIFNYDSHSTSPRSFMTNTRRRSTANRPRATSSTYRIRIHTHTHTHTFHPESGLNRTTNQPSNSPLLPIGYGNPFHS
jgi:site-specific DNA-cytosine methylase